jgi:glycosyltransferase involved in cell wall biosynthesis
MYSDDFGGPTTTFIQNDLLELAKHHEVKYLCTKRGKGGSFNYPDVEIVSFVQSPILRKIYWILEKNGLALVFRNRRFARGVNKIIDTFRPEVIQCNFGYEALRLTDNLSAANKRIPLIINFLGYDASFHLTRQSYVRKLISLSKRPAVSATCNTGFLKKNLEMKGIYFQENRVIHTGVRLDYFDRKNVYPSGPQYTFLQIATLSERKGQEITLLAFKMFLDSTMDKSRFRLILAGGKEDEYGEKIRNLPRELGITDYVTFIDWVTPEEARKLLLRVNCFVHHSRTTRGRTEGIPTVMSEAMSMELPVISTWHAGIPELVEDGVNGFLVQENDISAYAQCMLKILDWGFLKRNREKVMLEFNLLDRTRAFENFYKSILSRN